MIPHGFQEPTHKVEVFITEIGEERENPVPVISEEIVKINIPNSWEVAKFEEKEGDLRADNINFADAVIEFLFKNTSSYYTPENKKIFLFLEKFDQKEKETIKKFLELFEKKE